MEEKDWIYELEDILKISKDKFDKLSKTNDINIILDWIDNNSSRLSYQIYQSYNMYKSRVEYTFEIDRHIGELVYDVVESYGNVLNQFAKLYKNGSRQLTHTQESNMFNIINVIFAARDEIDIPAESA